jgi:hypothetical protein
MNQIPNIYRQIYRFPVVIKKILNIKIHIPKMKPIAFLGTYIC